MTHSADFERIKSSAPAARQLAVTLMSIDGVSISDVDRSLLINLADQQDAPSDRQAAQLLELRDRIAA